MRTTNFHDVSASPVTQPHPPAFDFSIVCTMWPVSVSRISCVCVTIPESSMFVATVSIRRHVIDDNRLTVYHKLAGLRQYEASSTVIMCFSAFMSVISKEFTKLHLLLVFGLFNDALWSSACNFDCSAGYACGRYLQQK